MDWINMAEGRDKGWTQVNTIMNFHFPYTVRNFLTSWKTTSFSRTLFHGLSLLNKINLTLHLASNPLPLAHLSPPECLEDHSNSHPQTLSGCLGWIHLQYSGLMNKEQWLLWHPNMTLSVWWLVYNITGYFRNWVSLNPQQLHSIQSGNKQHSPHIHSFDLPLCLLINTGFI